MKKWQNLLMSKNPILIFLGISLIILSGLGFNNILPFAEKGTFDYFLNVVFLVVVLNCLFYNFVNSK
tara:strand:- start:796 stop:996 length:201 start_codon:yes stop_codon:yes gene_type:complete